MEQSKLKAKGNISLLEAYKKVFTNDYKSTKNKVKRKRLAKKLQETELALEINKASISRKRNEKKTSEEKRCMMCGEQTKNQSGFCDSYAGSMFGCKETWKQEYGKMPTKEELNAKWRDE